MKIRCDYCGSYFEDTETVCPQCGAPNEQIGGGPAVPRTIGELQRFCQARRLPLEQMRFFIGEDYRGARAFGIYRDDGGSFVVYKNKSDGSRAVRYAGPDEAYAVGEIYQKLKSEIANQRQYQAARGETPGGRVSAGRRSAKRPSLIAIVAAILVVNMVVTSIFGSLRRHKYENGYYQYNGGTYYSQNDVWYGYDDATLSWLPVAVDEELSGNAADYYSSSYYSPDYDAEDFSDSSYYAEDSSDDWDDDDSDWDWGGGDWDDGATDWDSDW